MERRQISRVLISVSDKANLVKLAKNLSSLDVEIITTGGTSKVIKKENVDVLPVEDVTNFPEMMDGRVKTLHPLIFVGISTTSSLYISINSCASVIAVPVIPDNFSYILK